MHGSCIDSCKKTCKLLCIEFCISPAIVPRHCWRKWLREEHSCPEAGPEHGVSLCSDQPRQLLDAEVDAQGGGPPIGVVALMASFR